MARRNFLINFIGKTEIKKLDIAAASCALVRLLTSISGKITLDIVRDKKIAGSNVGVYTCNICLYVLALTVERIILLYWYQIMYAVGRHAGYPNFYTVTHVGRQFSANLRNARFVVLIVTRRKLRVSKDGTN